jgi:superfamily II DNA/RNA helicase
LIFDEADRLFEDEFIEQADSILDACKGSADLKVSLFSATIPPWLEILSRTFLKQNPIRITVGIK